MRNSSFLPLLGFLAGLLIPPAFAQTIPANTAIAVRLDQDISSRNAAANQRVKAQIDKDVVVHGSVLLPKGATAAVYVERVQAGGDSSRPAALWLRLDAVTVEGRAYPVSARYAGQQLFVSSQAKAGAPAAPSKTEGTVEARNAPAASTPDADGNTLVAETGEVSYLSSTVLRFRLKSPVKLNQEP